MSFLQAVADLKICAKRQNAIWHKYRDDTLSLQSVIPAGFCGDCDAFLVRRLKSTVNHGSSLRDFVETWRAASSILIFLFALFPAIPAMSQSIKSVRINEIQVMNTDGFRDEYGQASGWIELYNKGYGKVNVAGCTLKVKGKAYQIPKGDPATVIPTQGYLVFFAGGTPNKGTFHTNFTLDDTDFIAFYDADGKLVDQFQFNPVGMVENVSYGWFEDHDGKEKLMSLPATTPGSSNNTLNKVHRSEVFRQADPWGIVLTITNIVVVTIALTLLFFVFKYMGNYHTKKTTGNKLVPVKTVQTGNVIVSGDKKKRAVTNDELAAIAIALYKYSEIMRRHEEMVLTINKVSKVYSPWSSKIYGLRQFPKK
jgi:Na+-transporting methylmalonyl-CoA/oxaloacetate decarboxylase gamma subunit